MIREELVFVATCDISGHVRGKGFPARELPGRLKKGIGWTGSNLMMSPAGPIWARSQGISPWISSLTGVMNGASTTRSPSA